MSTPAGKYRFTGAVDSLISCEDGSRLPGCSMVDEPVPIDASGHVVFLDQHRGKATFREALRGDLTPE
jgi:hypothetical protein